MNGQPIYNEIARRIVDVVYKHTYTTHNLYGSITAIAEAARLLKKLDNVLNSIEGFIGREFP